MKRLLLSLILFFPSALAAQELHTFSNGEVADAEKINENFEELQRQIAEFSPLISGGTDQIIDEYGNQIIEVDCSSEPSALTTAFGEHTIESKLLFKVTGQCELGTSTIRNQQVAILGNEVGELGCSTSAELIGTINVEGGSLSIICANVTSIYARDSWIYLLGVASPEVTGVQSAVYVEFDELWPAQAIDITAYQTKIFTDTYTNTYIEVDLDLRNQSVAYLNSMFFNAASIQIGNKSNFTCIFCFGSVEDMSVDIGATAYLNSTNFGSAGDLSVDKATLGHGSSILYDDQKVEILEVVKLSDPAFVTLTNETTGCSAEQDGSSVVITCADGTSGVLASEGTVVVYPEGGIVGESPVQSWPTGTIVFEDNNGVLLAEASQIGNLLVFDLDNVKGTFVNLPADRVVVTGWRSGERIYFSSEDCSGQAFGTTDIMIYDRDGELAVPLPHADKQEILSNSYLKSGSGNFKTDSYTTSGPCNSEQSVVSAYPLVEYTPPNEFLNAAYPVALAQLP